MNYIYDVILNFNEELYEFYDWNKDDELLHIRKMPVIRVDDIFISDLRRNKIKINDNLNIRNKTELFQKKGIRFIENACIFTDGKEAIAALIKRNGLVLKSKMIIDEEDDAVCIGKKQEVKKINYKIIENNVLDEFKTRKERKIQKYIFKELEIMEKEKLSYIYFECFNEMNCINVDIKKEILNNFDKIYMSIYEILKLSKVNK